jgi:hypothetical protein
MKKITNEKPLKINGSFSEIMAELMKKKPKKKAKKSKPEKK